MKRGQFKEMVDKRLCGDAGLSKATADELEIDYLDWAERNGAEKLTISIHNHPALTGVRRTLIVSD